MKNSYIQKCNELLSNNKKAVILGCVFVVLQALVSIASSIFGAYYGIDVALVSKSVDKLILASVVILTLGILDTILFHLMYRRGIKVCKILGVDIREKVFNKAIYLDMDYHNHHASGAILNTIDYDVDLFSNGVTWTLPMLLRSIARIIVCFLIVTILNPKLSIILWIIAPIFGAISYFASKKMSVIHEKRRRINKQRIAYINEGIMGVKTIKSLNLEENAKEEFAVFNKKYLVYRMQQMCFMQVFWRAFDIAFYGALAALFIMSYKLSVSYGELYLYYTLFRLCLNAITDLSNNVDSFLESVVSTNKVYSLLKYEPLIKDKEITLDKNDDLKGDIEFKNIKFTYPKGETVLNEFNLTIPSKTKVAIVGKTGSGKSTIASLMYRFYEPNEGKILIDGIDYTDYKIQYLHNQIGFILQEPFLFDDTILNNVKYGKQDASIEEVIEACKTVGADEFISKLKDGYDTNIGEGGIILSIGQKQLLSFARLVLSNPNIVILDEATSNIDSHTEKIIQKNIDTLFKDKTCLYIAHRLSTIKNVDKIIYLDKGKIIEEGSHNELMKLNGKYATLYNNQFVESSLKKILE